MAKDLFLIGGGPGAVLAMRRHFKAALKEAGKPKPLVAYVGAASGDNAGFQRMISTMLAPLGGANVKAAKLAAKTAKVSEARAILEDCDVVFVSGGDVAAGMDVLHERDVVKLFRDLAQKKPMVGISAGSLMMAREWVRFPDDDTSKAELFPCLGVAPIHVDAHSEGDGWSELRVLMRLLHERGDPSPVAYGLPRKGCLRVRGENGVKLEPMGVPIPTLVVRRGKVVEGKPLPPA